jgi:signal transduction histidine kinase
MLIGIVWWATVGYLEEQTNVLLNDELDGLVGEFGARGLPGLSRVIEQRVTGNTGSPTLYLLIDKTGRPITGNLRGWPAQQPDADGWYSLISVNRDGRNTPLRGKSLNLRDGMRLLVAHDQSRLEATRALINDTFLWALGGGLVLALIGGFLMSYSVMRRIEAINRASREIMTGRLQRRMPLRGINDEFDQLSENLNAMLDRIDSLIEGVKSVADNIAHDLRTPLTRLRGRLENLSVRPGLDAGLHDELSAAMTEADHLLATFGALLRIARIESGTHDREWTDVDLGPLLRDAWELYQAVGEEKDIAVHLREADFRVHVDRDLLFQALCNLLDNAIKYSPPGSAVMLTATESADGISIAVADQGPGIPEAERTKVLDRFYRSASVTGIPGSGLGLSLVSAIANYHGGQLVLEDNAPGLRATLRLPAPRPVVVDRPAHEVAFAGISR